MKIAIVGGGISGLTAAHHLGKDHDVTLFEREPRLGGHTDTHEINVQGSVYRIDSGFIVFNHDHYPLFSALLEDLGVASQPTTMSFSARDIGADMEYNATDLGGLFCQRRNLVRPAFWRMIADIRQFYRDAQSELAQAGPGPDTSEFVRARGYSQAFYRWHLRPMAAALWSAPESQIDRFPVRHMLRFFDNHQMLQLSDRPQWRVVRGGSSSYVDALRARGHARFEVAAPVLAVERTATGVMVHTSQSGGRFDAVVMACHSDQALGLLTAPSPAERDILGAIGYQTNEAIVHGDTRHLPRRRRAWAAWNALVSDSDLCQVTYNMNHLQGVQGPDFLVTLNPHQVIPESMIYAKRRYAHPVFDHDAVAAQRRRGEINGVDGIYYCGAYWGFGFHEDGVRSAHDVVNLLRKEQARAA